MLFAQFVATSKLMVPVDERRASIVISFNPLRSARNVPYINSQGLCSAEWAHIDR